MRFLVAHKKGNKFLVKLGLDDGKEKWAETTEGVYDFVKKMFRGNDQKANFPGEEADVEYTVENGKYNVTRITKKGQSGGQTKQTEPPKATGYTCSGCGATLKDNKYEKCYNCNQASKTAKPDETKKPTCEDCGKELKDDKYTKCYTCNQKNPTKKYKGKESSETSEQIRRLSVLRACADAIQTLTGQIGDIETLGTMIETLYDRLYKKVS